MTPHPQCGEHLGRDGVVPTIAENQESGKGSGKFVMVPHAVIRSHISPPALAVYMALLLHRGQKTGLCNPSIPTIAADLELSHDTIERAIKELERSELVAVERHKDRRGHEYSFTGTHANSVYEHTQKPGCSESGTHAKTPPEHTQKPPRNKEEQDVVTRRNTKPSFADAQVDARHHLIRTLIQNIHQSKFKIVCQWDGSEARALSILLKANPAWTDDTITAMVTNRFAYDGVTPERPRVWLPQLAKYAAGPLDRFGKLNGGGVPFLETDNFVASVPERHDNVVHSLQELKPIPPTRLSAHDENPKLDLPPGTKRRNERERHANRDDAIRRGLLKMNQ